MDGRALCAVGSHGGMPWQQRAGLTQETIGHIKADYLVQD